MDLRDQCIFSIDPATARDLDDALSCELLPDGLFRVGVHIADVSYFVPCDSELDKCAADRATSVYLVNTVRYIQLLLFLMWSYAYYCHVCLYVIIVRKINCFLVCSYCE